MTGGQKPAARKIICRNKRAFHDYALSERFEAGVVLVGSEVKSLRDGNAHLSDAYADVREGELYLFECHISEYAWANQFNHPPRRPRKLLMHRREIDRLTIRVRERGYTIVPLQLYFLRGKVKVELALAKGKRQHDKRDAVRDRDVERELRAATGKRG